MSYQPRREPSGLNELPNLARRRTSSDVAPARDFPGLKSNPAVEGDLQVDRLESLFDGFLFAGGERETSAGPFRAVTDERPSSSSVFAFDLK